MNIILSTIFEVNGIQVGDDINFINIKLNRIHLKHIMIYTQGS